MTEEEAVPLLEARGRDLTRVAAAADEVREERAGPLVTYVRNQNINVTNICKNLRGFCGFWRSIGGSGAYCDDDTTLRAKLCLALSRDITPICLLSGVLPGFSTGKTS